MSLVGYSRRTLLARGAVALASSAVVAACGGTAQKAQNPVAVEFTQPVEIAFWHPQSGSNGKALDDMVAKFNSVNDRRITVQSTFQGSYDLLFEKNQVALNAGTPADLSVAYEQHVAEYMRGNGCVDLEPYTTDSALGYSKEALADIFPTYLEGLRFPQYGNKLLSFPFTKSLAVMYVNEEVLQRSNVSAMPRTWQEFAAAVQQASRTDSTLVVDPNLGAITGDASRSRTYG